MHLAVRSRAPACQTGASWGGTRKSSVTKSNLKRHTHPHFLVSVFSIAMQRGRGRQISQAGRLGKIFLG